MVDDTLISVITPVYNTSAELLDACAQSILGQEHANLEWIVVDDGSNRETAAHLDTYQELDQRVHIEHIPNGGVSHARNVGLSLARGAYIAFIDSDDIALPAYLSSAYSAARSTGADIVCGRSRTVSGGAVTDTPFSSGESCILVGAEHLDDFVRYTVIGFPVGNLLEGISGIPSYQIFPKLFRASILKGIRFCEQMTFSEDSLFCLDAVKQAGSIALVNEAWLDYVIHSASTTSTTGISDLEKRLEQFANYERKARDYGIADYDLGLRFFRFIRSSLVPLSSSLSLFELSRLIKSIYGCPFANLLDAIDYSRYDVPTQTKAFISMLRKRKPLLAALWLKVRAMRQRKAR